MSSNNYSNNNNLKNENGKASTDPSMLMRPYSHVDKIQFSILSAQDIERLAVVQVLNESTYDAASQPIVNSNT